jgi:molecular chaperone DnaK
LIDRNTTIPTRKSETFSTAEDDQTAVTIRVFQGEREMAADNKLLGQFDLVGIPPAPRGVPQIEVTFDIDANGIVNVSAKDKSSGKQQTIRIQASGGLNEAEVERMVREAEAHAEEDRRRRELVDMRNQADAAIYTAEKALKAEGRLPADVKSDIDGAVSALRAVMQRDQAQPIRDGIERLRRASMRIGEAPNRTGQGSGGEGSAAGDNPDVIDAEFKEVDDDHRKAS